VDDDDRLRALLRAYLAEHGYRVTAAADASEARRRFEGLIFDLAILDVMMPGEDGMALAASLRGAGHRLPILMLTARGNAEDRIRGLEAGVDDYLAKPFEPRELLLRIEAILRRSRAPMASGAIIEFGEFRFDLDRGQLAKAGRHLHLTDGEVSLLRSLGGRPGVTIARHLLHASADAGQGRAVDVQITRLRRKIEDDPRRPRHLQTVRGEGYVLWANVAASA